jgi:hypothetical protein
MQGVQTALQKSLGQIVKLGHPKDAGKCIREMQEDCSGEQRQHKLAC